MGGSYSLQAALVVPDLTACVLCYGRLLTEDATIAGLSAPVLGIYGREDRGIPAKSVEQFQAQARSLKKDVTMHVYDSAGHAFMNVNNAKGYNPEATVDAWKKILSFLEATLKPAAKD